jgi:parallel beta-helix repeat protein
MLMGRSSQQPERRRSLSISPMSFLVRGAVAVTGCGALMLGMITAGAAPASAASLPCGYTATTSIKLTANINCKTDTTDNGITIGASDITVNLNGHSILGPGANVAGPNGSGTVGIADNVGGPGTVYDNVTIENGTISNFNGDIVLEGDQGGSDLTGAVVDKITMTNNTLAAGYGLFGGGLSGASIHNLSISDAEYGVELDQSQASTVSDNKLQSPFYGLYDSGGSGNTWSGNTLSNVNFYGIDTNGTTAAVVKSNTFSGGIGGTGIFDGPQSSGTSITGNTMDGIGAGIGSFQSSDATISSNKGTTAAFGIYTEESTDFTLTGNQFSNSQYGIETDCPVGELLKGNTANHNSEAGVFVYTNPSFCSGGGTLSARLDNNTGNDNRFGLYSQIVTSGSGNKATGNKIVNCHQVSCTTGGTTKGAKAPARGSWRTPPAPATTSFGYGQAKG